MRLGRGNWVVIDNGSFPVQSASKSVNGRDKVRRGYDLQLKGVDFTAATVIFARPKRWKTRMSTAC